MNKPTKTLIILAILLLPTLALAQTPDLPDTLRQAASTLRQAADEVERLQRRVAALEAELAAATQPVDPDVPAEPETPVETTDPPAGRVEVGVFGIPATADKIDLLVSDRFRWNVQRPRYSMRDDGQRDERGVTNLVTSACPGLYWQGQPIEEFALVVTGAIADSQALETVTIRPFISPWHAGEKRLQAYLAVLAKVAPDVDGWWLWAPSQLRADPSAVVALLEVSQ